MTVIKNSFYGDALQAGQIWIGTDTAHPPAAAGLTAGTNISITPASGSIAIGTSGLASFTWTNRGTTTPINIQAFNGYVTSGTPVFFIPGALNLNDIFSISTANGSNGFSINSPHLFGIRYAGTAGNILSTTDPTASISLICTSIDSVNTYPILTVLSTNGATFTF